MKRIALHTFLGLLITGVLVVAQPAATGPTARAAVAASAASAAMAAPVSGKTAELRAQALAQLADGDFQAGQATLSKALKITPDDPAAKQAGAWVKQFLGRQADRRRQRREEFDEAVARAKSLLKIAQGPPPDEERLTKLREQARNIGEIFMELRGASADAENYKDKKWFTKRLDKDAKAITDVLAAMPAAGKGRDERRGAVRRAKQAFGRFERAARDRSWDTFPAGEESVHATEEQAEAFLEAMDDLGAMASEYPWRAALDRLRLAKEILGGETAFLSQAWARKIITGAEKHAAAQAEAKEWYPALALYSGLADLFNKDGRYTRQVDRVSRKARVLALYGPPSEATHSGGDTPGDTPSTRPAGEANAKWRRHIRGVDAYMVRKAIGRIEETYVETVNYRKVLLGALQAIRVLGELPKLAETFPGLGEKDSREAFLKRIDELITEARTSDRVDHELVRLALNRLLRANRETVRVPDEVIDVEFASGMTEQLDRFSQMIWPSDWAEFRKHTMGSFSGVGIQIQMENSLLKVVSPLEDTPAYRAGIQAGDFITEIDGASAENIEIDEAVRRITGPKGTKVELTIKRPGKAPFKRTLVRAEIHMQTVKGWKRINGGGWDWMIDKENHIGYLRLTSFTKDTAGNLRDALAEMRSRGAKGLILDLRFNPGGLLNVAVDVADEFLSNGTIVSTKGRQQPRNATGASEDGGFMDGVVVALVNQYSASASEIVSGALKDLGRAIIVGRRSFGKGSVQNLMPIREDFLRRSEAYLKLTTAYYYLPNGRCLHRVDGAAEWGVEPDVHVPMTPKQLRRWLALRRKTEVLQQRDPGVLEAQMAEQLAADVQLDAALLVCRSRLLGKQAAAAVAKAR